MFIHEDPEFESLVQIVADRTGIAAALVEKDYWVTHTVAAAGPALVQTDP